MKRQWSKEEIREVYATPLLDLVFRSATIHRQYHDPREVQMNTLLSIKTGGCSEDCGYCSQSARYETQLKTERLLPLEVVVEAARNAKENGSSRFCMGAAWREVRSAKDFDRVLEMVRQVKSMGLEVCSTLGMVNKEQASKLKEAGLDAYNHNLDTSREFYPNVVSTRSYDDRLDTIEAVTDAGISLCSGGILGLGESEEDRVALIWQLASLKVPPESVPVNVLVPIAGTPLAKQPRVPFWDVLRTIATARIVIPTARVRLSAGRHEMSAIEQGFCFLAGANSIFAGDKLLTTPNANFMDDKQMLELLGLYPRELKAEASAQQVAHT
jgi:biotin synthase